MALRCVLLLLLAASTPAPAQTPSPADLALLDAASKRAGLFDPSGARRVRTTVIQEAPDGRASVEGWASKEEDRPTWIVLDDLSLAPVAPDVMVEDADFVTGMREWLDAPPMEDHGLRLDGGVPVVAPCVFAWAAWARRLGHDDLAAALLAAARSRGEGHRHRSASPEERLGAELASAMLRTAVRAFTLRADAEALLALRALDGRRHLQSDGRRLADRLRRDLERREREGRAGVDRAIPEHLDDLPTDARVALLIGALEDVVAVRVHRWADDVCRDPRVLGLVATGEPAVPALLDVLEHDERLTRSLRATYDGQSLEMYAARDAAWVALREVLRLEEFDPIASDEERAGWRRQTPANAQTARRLRAYWEANGRLTFEERLRRALLDWTLPLGRRREAAWAMCGRPRHARRFFAFRGEPGRAPSRALALTDPTAAEAMLVAFDADVAAPEDRRRATEDPESVYIVAIAALGDPRIVPALRARFAAATRPSLRVELAMALHALGASEPLDEVAGELAAGELRDLPQRAGFDAVFDAPSTSSRLLGVLASARRPACDEALLALADPAHPQFRLALDKLIGQPWGWNEDDWSAHPACLRVLRTALRDETDSGRSYTLSNGTLARDSGGHSWSGPKPDWLDPAACGTAARGRVCDEAATYLGDLVPAFPRHHALLTDRDASLAAVRATAERTLERLRRPTPAEAAAMGLGRGGPRVRFLPDVPPLEAAATEEDVAAGRALFHLDRAVRADLRLPATAEVVKPGGRRQRGLILQAETGPDGERVYGVVTADGMDVLPASALSGVCPLPDAAEHRAALRTAVDAVTRGDLEVLGTYFEAPLAPAVLERWLEHARGLPAADLERWLESQLIPTPGGGWRLGS